MGGHVNKLGKEMTGAVEAYNKLVGSLETRVMVSARKFVDLQVDDEPIELHAHIDLSPRDVTAAELVASANDELLALEETPSDITACSRLADRRAANQAAATPRWASRSVVPVLRSTSRATHSTSNVPTGGPNTRSPDS